MTTRKEREKYRAVCYAMLRAIGPKLSWPVCFVIREGKNADYAGLYEEMEKWHKITITIKHNLNNANLFETVAHELQHAHDMERGRAVDHNVNFWKRLDRDLIRFGLAPSSKKHKKDCRELGRIMGNGG